MPMKKGVWSASPITGLTLGLILALSFALAANVRAGDFAGDLNDYYPDDVFAGADAETGGEGNGGAYPGGADYPDDGDFISEGDYADAEGGIPLDEYYPDEGAGGAPRGGGYGEDGGMGMGGFGGAPAPAAGSGPGPGIAGGEIDGPDAEGNMVTEIEVLNTVTTTPEQIIYRMSTRVGHPLRERILDGDFQRLASMGFFDDIQIKKEMVQGGVKITVVVREKDIIRRIEFTGNQQIGTRKLNTLIESKVGERYDAGKGNRDRRAIEDHLHSEYYYFGEVELDVQPFEDGVRLVFDVAEGGRLYVGDIQFRGNTVFTRKELLAKMETKRSGLISRGKYLRRAFERDIERIRMSYLDKGHLDVRVIERPMEITANVPTSRWQRRDVFINLDIEEGEEYHVGSVNFNFVGTSLVSEESIRAVIRTMPGEVYSPLMIQEDAMKIRDIYGQAPNSRYFTRVMPEPVITEDGLVMDVTFNIQESPEVIVEGVRVTGLTHTKEVVVLREFEVFPGEKIDSRRFQRSKENVENLAYFKEPVNIEIREGSAPDRAILVAELEETTTGKITAGVGVSSADSIVGSFGIQQRNFDYRDRPKTFRDLYTGKAFRGAGQDFSLNISAGAETQAYSVNFTNPWIFGKPISMSISPYYNAWEYDNEYHEARYGVTWTFGKRLFDMKELTVSAGYKVEMVDLSNFEAVNGSYSREYTRQEGNHNVSRWLAGINYDSRDSTWEPTRGALASANLELAGKYALSSKDFWRGFLSSQYFLPIFTDSQERNWTIGVRGDFAYAKAYGDGDGKDKQTGADYSDEVPYYERFHLGGVGSVRGFDNRGISPRDGYDNAVGGEAMASASVEFFFPIWDRIIRGSMFYDVGTVWRYGGDPQYDKGYDKATREWSANTARKIRSSYGFGLHVKTPLGPMPVRLYYAFPLKREDRDEIQRFQFSMGAMF